MNDHPSPTTPRPQARRTGWKRSIVFISAVVASTIVHSLKGQSNTDLAIHSAEILGGAIAYFGIAMIFALFIRGPSGAAIGVIIVCVAASLGGYETYRQHKPEREALSALNQHQKTITQAAHATLDRSGHMDVDPSLIRDALDDLSVKSKALDPQTAAATDAIVAVTSEMVKPAAEGRKLWSEIATDAFQNPNSIKTRQEIDSRITRLNAFRDAARRLQAVYPDLDIRLKTELARRNIPPIQAKNVANSYIQSARMDIAIPLARSNVDYADVLIRKFELLKSHFGAWRVKNNTIYFDDSIALRDWNDTSRRLFQIAEQREALERELLAAMEGKSK